MKIITSAITIIMIFTLLLASCTPYQKPPNPLESFATYRINGSIISAENFYNHTFNNGGIVSNTVTLSAADSSKIKFVFEGTNTKTLQLKAFPDAIFIDSQGQDYNVVRGELKITNYNVNQLIYTLSGTFNFVAKSTGNANDSVVITDGTIKNISN